MDELHLNVCLQADVGNFMKPSGTKITEIIIKMVFANYLMGNINGRKWSSNSEKFATGL